VQAEAPGPPCSSAWRQRPRPRRRGSASPTHSLTQPPPRSAWC
jgi:hypothetical protein